MFDILRQRIRSSLLKYPFIKRFFSGEEGSKDYYENLGNFHDQLRAELPEGYLQALRLQGNDEDLRSKSFSTYCKFIRKTGFTIATELDKIQWIRQMPSEKMLQFLAAFNRMSMGTRKLGRWKPMPVTPMVGFEFGIWVYFKPPNDSHLQLRLLLDRMKFSINEKNIHFWAAKMYSGIVFSHVFEDGNGKVARAVYHLMRKQSVPNEIKIMERSEKITEVCNWINQSAIYLTFLTNRIRLEQVKDFDLYFAAETESKRLHLLGSLEYLAARKVLMANEAWKEGTKEIVYGSWPDAMKKQFELEFQMVRLQWFWNTQQFVDSKKVTVIRLLDDAIL